MISATSALNSIEAANNRIRADETRLGQVIENATLEMTRVRAEQADLYRSLASIRMDALKQDQILRTLDAAESKALAAIEAQTASLSNLTQQQADLSSQLQAASSGRNQLSEAVIVAANAISTQEEATQARMASDLAWQAQSAKVDGVADRAQAAEEKARQSEADRDEKSKPYLADALFTYLWQRGYGTSTYRFGSITRMGDAFVARVVHYEQARQNYFALTEIPKRLREHADRLKEELAAEEQALVALERKALEADGIEKLEANHQTAAASLEAQDQLIADLETRQTALEQERRALTDDTSSRGLGGALTDLATSLQREDLRVLLREALETPSSDDDRIVAQLQKLAGRMEQLEAETEQARQTALDLAKRRAELERSSQDFRRSGYERGGGTFANDKLIGDVLGGIIGGVLSSRELRDALRSGYRQGGGSNSGPRRGGTIFGGGFGRGGGGGRSSGGGGGFRTGGGF